MKFARIVMVAFAIEVLAIASLVAVVALFGPSTAEGDMAFAKETGIWLGPIAGFVFTVLLSWFAFRNLESKQLTHCVATRIVVAVVDVMILILGGSGFEMVFLFSNLGKVLAGYLGGLLASR